MKRSLFVLFVAAGLLATASAQPRRYGKPPAADRPVGQFLQDLNLTDAQGKQVEDLRYQMQKEQIANRSKIASERLELRRLLQAERPDQSAIGKKLSEISALEAAAKQLRVNHWFKVNAMLTPEQQQVWKKALEFGGAERSRRMMMHERMDRPRGWRNR